MKKTIVLIATALSVALSAEVVYDYAEGEKSAALVTPEIQAAAETMLGTDAARQLLHAMRLQMSKYDNDMQSASGRRAWHGKLLYSEIHTNELCAVEVYSNAVDGAVWRYRQPFKPKAPVSSARYSVQPSTNGVPARLARARMKAWRDSQATNTVILVEDAND